MGRGRHFEIHRVSQTIMSYKGIPKIHVFEPDGIIVPTTDEGDLNKKVQNENSENAFRVLPQ